MKNPLYDAWTLHGHDYYAGRKALVEQYAWAIPPPEVCQRLIVFAGPLVELGAGTGYWGALISSLGGDILCFDKEPRNKMWYRVEQGLASEVSQRYPERTLLLCWPMYDNPMAVEALRAYTGQKVVYIGEGKGGCTADDSFHETLKRAWRLEETIEIPQWVAIHDRVYFYVRKEMP